MSLEKQLGKDYEERLLNYLLHRRENYVLEVNLRHIAKAFGGRVNPSLSAKPLSSWQAKAR